MSCFNTLTRYTYSSFQCSVGLTSHYVDQPFIKYVTYFLSAMHVLAMTLTKCITKIACQFPFILRWALLSLFSPQGQWKLLGSIKYPDVIYQPALKRWFICGSKDIYHWYSTSYLWTKWWFLSVSIGRYYILQVRIGLLKISSGCIVSCVIMVKE